VKHIVKVMRHGLGDSLFVTDGKGKIFEGIVESIKKDKVEIKISGIRKYKEKFKNITLCIPNIKKPDRLEFVVEKSVELGITNFIIFNSKRTVAKKVRIDRLNKVALSAMKQSLNAYLPAITFYDSLSFLEESNSEVLLFDQESSVNFNISYLNPEKNYYLLFGPEGGFEKGEISAKINTRQFSLAPNRLRTETAVITAVSRLTL